MTRRKILTPDGGSPLVLGGLEPYFEVAKHTFDLRRDFSSKGVFLNVPYDYEHIKFVDAYIMSIFDCGFIPVLAAQNLDCSKTRIEKIADEILECRYSVHDLSLKATDTSEPRLNMAFELGMAFGVAKARGNERPYIVMTDSQYGWQRYISDISGFDIVYHDFNIDQAIAGIRSFFVSVTPNTWMPTVDDISSKLQAFYVKLHKVTGLDTYNITFGEKTLLMCAYLLEQDAANG